MYVLVGLKESRLDLLFWRSLAGSCWWVDEEERDEGEGYGVRECTRK